MSPAGIGLTGAPRRAAPRGEYLKVEIRGTLRTGVVAIGGETTGTTITANGTTLELDFAGNERLQNVVDALDGEQVTVRGTLARRPGVEVRDRWVVTVRSLTVTGTGDNAERGRRPRR